MLRPSWVNHCALISLAVLAASQAYAQPIGLSARLTAAEARLEANIAACTPITDEQLDEARALREEAISNDKASIKAKRLGLPVDRKTVASDYARAHKFMERAACFRARMRKPGEHSRFGRAGGSLRCGTTQGRTRAATGKRNAGPGAAAGSGEPPSWARDILRLITPRVPRSERHRCSGIRRFKTMRPRGRASSRGFASWSMHPARAAVPSAKTSQRTDRLFAGRDDEPLVQGAQPFQTRPVSGRQRYRQLVGRRALYADGVADHDRDRLRICARRRVQLAGVPLQSGRQQGRQAGDRAGQWQDGRPRPHRPAASSRPTTTTDTMARCSSATTWARSGSTPRPPTGRRTTCPPNARIQLSSPTFMTTRSTAYLEPRGCRNLQAPLVSFPCAGLGFASG